MKTKHISIGTVIMAAALAIVLGASSPASSTVVVNAAADVHVWLDNTRDVYPSYDDVVISIRAANDCYATVFVVDTEGFVHIVHPLSPRANAWLYGGRTYRYTAREVGLCGLGGRGVAHVFAITSPYPFDYSHYDAEVFAGGFGYRIYGDPFVACREIYVSLLPASCRWDFVGVGFARFYIREWSRYPHYLCGGHGVHVHVGDYCPRCAYVYDAYRVHFADPLVVIHPRVRFNGEPRRYAEVRRSTRKYKSVANERLAGATGVTQQRVPRTSSKAVSARTVSTRNVSTKTVSARTVPTKTVSPIRSVAKTRTSKQTVVAQKVQQRSKTSSPVTKGAARSKSTAKKKTR